MPIDDQYLDDGEKDEVKTRNKVTKAQWFGGTVRFGKDRTVTYQGMRKVDPVIKLRWEEGEPQPGMVAVVEVIIDGKPDSLIIEPEYQDMDRMVKRRLKEYVPLAESWALWKWHTTRGTPVNEFNGYLTEPGFVKPEFVWEKPAEQAAA